MLTLGLQKYENEKKKFYKKQLKKYFEKKFYNLDSILGTRCLNLY